MIFQPRLSSNATIYIKILDINDNSPNCSTAQPVVLTDDYAVGIPFGAIKIIDSDEGINGTVRYRVQNDPDFEVSADG